MHYNEKFRELLWDELGKLSLLEKKLLFSVESLDASEVAKVLIHSVRSNRELKFLLKILTNWGKTMSIQLEYVRRKLAWIDIIAIPRLEQFLLGKKLA